MQCPKCHATVADDRTQCPECDVVFHKYQQYLERRQALDEQRREPRRSGLSDRIGAARRRLLTPTPTLPDYWWGYLMLWIAFVVWGGHYLLADLHQLGWEAGFLHSANLPFHEAGHVVFGFFGDWIGSLGGTLGQLLMPLICGGALLWTRRDTFGASITLWWFGQNFLDIAPYIGDARAGVLPLLGGNYGHSSPYGFHDWEFILGETGLLAYDKALANASLGIGRLLIVLALAWGALLLYRARKTDTDD